MTSRLFRNRREAGEVLAGRLAHYRGHEDLVVLALPRGGVPVAFEVANALRAPLDVLVVRKLGAPGSPGLAVGAIAVGGVVVTNDDVIRACHVEPEALEAIANSEQRELARREKAYRDDRPPAEVAGKTVVLVDDGLATGATMYAALRAVRSRSPSRVVAAVPVAPRDTCEELGGVADEVICASTPGRFTAVGAAYWEFDRTDDGEVRELLAMSTRERPVTPLDDPAATVRRAAVAAPGGLLPGDELRAVVGDARFVLIGEASHGSHEFYGARAHMTRRLIEEKGFSVVAVEADWPDACEARPSKIIVWEHNSHLGDARATELGDSGELNLGQLVRARYPGECCSIGLTTYTGTVTASDDWDEPAKIMRVRPALPGSVEAPFHGVTGATAGRLRRARWTPARESTTGRHHRGADLGAENLSGAIIGGSQTLHPTSVYHGMNLQSKAVCRWLKSDTDSAPS